jgi:hypothetical protein
VAAGTEHWVDSSNYVEGEWEAETSGADAGSSHGCAFSFGNLSAFTANYQRVSGGTYSRCTLGPCLTLSSISRAGNLGYPPFIKVFVLRYQFGAFGPALCFGSAPIAIPDCSVP